MRIILLGVYYSLEKPLLVCMPKLANSIKENQIFQNGNYV